MSKISIEGNASGTGTLTIAAPNTNSNRILNLPDASGTMVVTGGAQTIEFAAGTVSAPSITTTGDTNTGIFFPAADTIAFTEGGTEAMRIDSSGNVGIGTNSPSTYGKFVTYSSGGYFSVDTNGQVISAQLLDVGTAGGRFTGYSSRGALGSVNIEQTTTSADGGYIGFRTSGSGSTSPTERMRIDSSGNVGIGTTSPISLGSGFTTLTINGAGGGGISMAKSDTQYGYVYADNNNLSVQTTTTIPIILATNNTERARITSGGNFCINSTVSASGGVDILSVTAPANYFASMMVNTSYQFATLLLKNSATANDNVWVRFDDGTTTRGNIDYNRSAGLVRYNTASDATLKNIIGDSDGTKSVEILNSTRIREFAWKDDETQKPQIGVIAQELYETYKGAVSVGGDVEKTDNEGNVTTEYRPWAVDKTAFTFHLVAGWQAHEKLIKQQAETIAALEARIAAIENGA